MLLSIIQGIFKSKLNMNELVIRAKAGNEEVMNDLLFASASFLKKTASFVCKRPIDEHDEEYSVAMDGLHEAVLAYDHKESASFQTFAHIIIKRRLIDYIRKEISRNEKLMLLESADEESSQQHYIFDKQSIDTYTEEQLANARKDELLSYNKLLAEYNLSFEELAKATPKHEDARKTAFLIAEIIADSTDLYQYLIDKRKLPLRELESLVEVSRKTLERQRKYIIAIVLLLNSEFTFIKDFVKGAASSGKN
ncbi:RNA polymerase sigma-I factor [Ureibacillus aquaedulcis]|uniref:RNA polymerase sigma factor SigI n=1 Tax=Ureibacillus aquaedulcis TaxID=3058421 RepID=A0ABT8GMI6_9BACL|nr:RNA polymerase sigma-I factor [Ureibacillus sp. BA0131]MDN4492635.1 RNA polymerase sigma-I factor [Ureibacillus sp. BA0131]